MAEWAEAPPISAFFSTMTVREPAWAATVEAVRPPIPVPTTTMSASMSHDAGGSTGAIGMASGPT